MNTEAAAKETRKDPTKLDEGIKAEVEEAIRKALEKLKSGLYSLKLL